MVSHASDDFFFLNDRYYYFGFSFIDDPQTENSLI